MVLAAGLLLGGFGVMAFAGTPANSIAEADVMGIQGRRLHLRVSAETQRRAEEAVKQYLEEERLEEEAESLKMDGDLMEMNSECEAINTENLILVLNQIIEALEDSLS